MKKENNFADLTGEEICSKERELRTELMLLRLKRKIGQLEKTHRFLEIRRDIARLVGLRLGKGRE
jgi:ribosomal protein L29